MIFFWTMVILQLKGDTKLAETVKPIKIADHDFQNHANCKVGKILTL